jgi:methionyl-tRNA formyltransferase
MLRVVFMGTPSFAVPTLAAILAAGHRVVAAFTRAPRAAGRGMVQQRSPVHAFAAASGIAVFTPASLREAAAQHAFTSQDADVAVVVAYGLLLPKPILDAPRHGCLNLHASALPRWRGAAPIQRAVMAGDTETAVVVMRMEEGLDTGPVCLSERVAIPCDATAGELADTLAHRGADLMPRALAALEEGALTCAPQSSAGVTYAAKIAKGEARIDFTLPARAVHNRARGLSPVPGAWFETVAAGRSERIKVLKTELAQGAGPPGTLLDDRLAVACGDGAVRLLVLQRAGKRAIDAAEFLRGCRLPRGLKL